MELITAERRGFQTTLKWLEVSNGTVTSVILKNGDTKPLGSVDELCSYYSPEADHSLFKEFKMKKVEKMSKKGSNPEPQGEKPKPPPNPPSKISEGKKKKGGVRNAPQEERPEPPSGMDYDLASPQSDETFLSTIEVLYVLQMIHNDEVKFEMEFEDMGDFNYKFRKLKETYPTYIFRMKTLRSVVSYVKL